MEKRKYKFGLPNPNTTILASESPVTQLLQEEVINNGKKDIPVRISDVYYLFNQQRLNRIGLDNVNQWLLSLTPKQQQFRKNMTDDELLDFVKSRHIQSASELLAYSQYLERMYPNIVTPVDDKPTDKQPDVEPLKTE